MWRACSQCGIAPESFFCHTPFAIRTCSTPRQRHPASLHDDDNPGRLGRQPDHAACIHVQNTILASLLVALYKVGLVWDKGQGCTRCTTAGPLLLIRRD